MTDGLWLGPYCTRSPAAAPIRPAPARPAPARPGHPGPPPRTGRPVAETARGRRNRTPLRGRDIVGLGVDGHRLGLPLSRKKDRARIDELLEAVGATAFGDRPVGLLSGGEQQRLRVGQALADDPALLLCDEPLTSLDLANQQAVVRVIDRHRRERGAAVLLVTHDINPVLSGVDRILYIANGRFTLGTPDEVLTTETLSALYGAPVYVVRAGGQLIVVGAPDADDAHHHHHDEDDA